MDNINPAHYKDRCSMECIDVMIGILGPEAVIHGCLMNVVKYLWRYKDKNGAEDLQKAFWYLEKAGYLSVLTSDEVNEALERVSFMYSEIAKKENSRAD